MAKRKSATIVTQDKSMLAKAKDSVILIYHSALLCKFLHDNMPSIIDAMHKLIGS